MFSTERHHTIHSCVRDGGSIIGVLEKDWYSAEWCDAFSHHFRVPHGNHIFHVTSDVKWFTLAHAENMVASVARGRMQTVDLREFSITDLIQKGKK